MAVHTFAAIDIGSYELEMKIFEFTSKGGMKEIDSIRSGIDLGTETYQDGKISREHMDELCEVLTDYARIMKGYNVDSYRAYGTSAIRETKNNVMVTEQIKLRTGIKLDILSNSEQRFLHYKAAASKGERFKDLISDSCAIVDIGGGSIQISLFDNNSLVATQNLRLGVLRLMDMLTKLRPSVKDVDSILYELIDNQLEIFKTLYLKNRRIKNIILIDDYISTLMDHSGHEDRMISAADFWEKSYSFMDMTTEELAKNYEIPEESAEYLYPATAIVSRMLRITGAEVIWSPGVTLCDGMAYEYGQKEKLIKDSRNFENDIIDFAKVTCRRYQGNLERNELLERIAVKLFDATKKIHDMTKREKLLLRIACLLNDCGRYICIDEGAECGYDIIMATEIIGLSHAEREIIANVVKFNKIQFEYYNELAMKTLLTKGNYLKIAKLSALLRLADGICRSYRNKVSDARFSIKDGKLTIIVDANDNISLEQGFFFRKASLFEEAFSIKPVLKQSKKNQDMFRA